MSGGSWDYAYSKVRQFAEDLTVGYEDDDHQFADEQAEEAGEESEPFEQHPLRLKLSRHMLHLASVMRAIEWSDSGDTGPDHWVQIAEAFLNEAPGECSYEGSGWDWPVLPSNDG